MSSASPIDTLVIGMAADRLAVYSSLAVIFGVGLFTTLLAPDRVARELAQKLRHILNTALAIFIFGTFLWLPIEAAQISGGWSGASQWVTLQTLLRATTSGSLWLERAIVCLSLFAIRLTFSGRVARQMMFLLSAISLLSLTFVGHAVLEAGWLGALHRGNDAAHIIGASGWIGCLVPLLPCFSMIKDPDWRSEARVALIRFSTFGHAAVVVVFLTGAVNTYLILGHLPRDLGSLYQKLLLAKIFLALGMVALALVNRYWVVPRLHDRGSGASRDLKRFTFAELGLATVVLALVSLFGILDPTGS